jgi:Zn-dependent protease
MLCCPGEDRQEANLEILPLGFAWYVVFVISVTVHEAAHSFVAMKLGDKTAYHQGQVTLDPVPHIRREPIGMIIVPIVTFLLGGWMLGWASAPYDPYWAERYPKRAAWMGLAGPAGNVGLVLLAAVFIHIGIWTGMFYAPETITFSVVVEANSDGLVKGLAVMASIMFSLNLILFVFNLIPIAPLDGTSLMEFVLRGEALRKYRYAMRNPSIRIFGFIIAWTVFDVIFGPIHTIALNLLYPGSWYY